MNNKYFLILPLLFLFSNAYAERRALPPVVDNSTSTGGGSAYVASTPSNNAMYELLGRLEQLQLEVQQLRGLVEEQSQTINNLKTRQTNIYSDLDQRLQILSNPGQEAGEGFSQNIMAAEVVQNSVSQASQSTQASQISQATSQATQIATQPSQVEQSTSQASQAVEPKLSMAEDSSEMAPTTTPAVSQKGLYKAAYESLRNGHNSQAISAFNAIIRDFPAGKYADNSQYWLGEAYKVNQDVDAARNAFSKVVEVYPNSPKVPDALLKLGYIELDQNNIAKARDYLTQVTVNYPGTTAAHLAAKKIMKLDQQ